ncbi:hypothetical protein [Spiroplasma endosymbiont of Phyllotreta cruciferae]|uniref:hypothetical protein n=1 Tax=Spiroplasma endosymbiont of Phyllotreta cruciferae TaxID=2886375 RepID=UPI0020A04A37|nr:hypothetical protein [Spiroplasma endosymbiont of Phyllotreta cruciferae]
MLITKRKTLSVFGVNHSKSIPTPQELFGPWQSLWICSALGWLLSPLWMSKYFTLGFNSIWPTRLTKVPIVPEDNPKSMG